MANQQVEQIERQIKDAKVHVDYGNSLDRLLINKDFKKVVLDGYFEREAIRLVHLKADPNFQKPEKQAGILLQIDAIGALSAYLNGLKQMAAVAGKDLVSAEAEIEQILVEDLEEAKQ